MTTDVAAPPPTKRRWKLRTLVALSLLLAAGMAAAARWAGSVEREMAAIAAELDVSDPGWRLADIDAARKPVADADNAATKMLALAKKVPRKVFTWDQRYPKPFPREVQLNGVQLDSLDKDLLPHAQAISEVLSWKSLTIGQFPNPVDKEGKIDQAFLFSLLAFSQTIEGHAISCAQHGRFDEAAESCRMILDLAHLLRDEPFLMSALVRAAFQSTAAKSAQRLLAQGELSEESLRRLQDALARESAGANMYHAMRSERAYWHSQVSEMAAGRKPLEDAIKGMKLAGWDMFWADYFPSRLLRYYAELFREKNELVELTKLPMHELLVRADAMRKDLSKRPPFVQQQSGSHLLGAVTQTAEPMAAVRCATAAVACERYRLKHRRWPVSLDELVREKLLDAMPTDPYDGKPLRFKLLADGVFVYSVGPDRADHGGIDGFSTRGVAGTDAGFRLWDAPARRQPPLPVPANAKKI